MPALPDQALMIERDLFGTVRLVRNWGRIGTTGQELVAIFDSEEEAGAALEELARLKRRRGYRDLRGNPTAWRSHFCPKTRAILIIILGECWLKGDIPWPPILTVKLTTRKRCASRGPAGASLSE